MPYKDPVVKALKQKEYSKKYYENNKSEHRARTKAVRDKARAQFYEFKSTLSCVKCGENHPATFDFHHHTPHPSNKKISEILRNRQYSLAIQEIAEKCIVLCANCHRKHHHEERHLRRKQIEDQ